MRCHLPSVPNAAVPYSVLFGLVALLCSLATDARAFRNLEAGDAIPDFQATSLGGTQMTPADLQGKTVVLAFVRLGQEKSLEVLRALAGQAQDSEGGAEYLAVVTNPEEGDVVQWSREVNAILTVFPDSDGTLYGRFGVLVTPSTGVFDPQGAFVGAVNGYTADYAQEVSHLVRVSQGLETLADQSNQAEQIEDAKSEERKTAERSLEKARLLAERKMREKALSAAEEAVSADPEYLEARIFLGSLLLDLSDDNADQAMVHFQKVLEFEPNNSDASVGLARVKSIQGEHEEAAEILTRAAMLNPRPEKIYYELGRVHERAENYQKSVEAYRKALDRLLE